MNINKLFMAVIILILFTALSSSWAADSTFSKDSQEAWIQEMDSTVKFTYLEAIIHVKIKNNNDHVEYFKISQQYYQTTPPMNWTLSWTSPSAVKMVKEINDNGDYGWAIQPGETKEVTFKEVCMSPSGVPLSIAPAYIARNASMANQFWPLLPEPGLTATWFMPNEIEYLNPNLELKLWEGKFCFWIKNVDTTSPRVQGIVRAPIVPIDSKLIYSNPKVTYISDELPWANTAAWDVTLYPGQSKHYAYNYQWPSNTSTSSSGSAGSAKYNIPTTAAATTNATVPTSQTGVPFALFVVGAIIIAGGVTYAKFFR